MKVPVIPARDMRPAIVNGLTPQAQWDYKAGRALPKVRVKGLPDFPCDANELRRFHERQRGMTP